MLISRIQANPQKKSEAVSAQLISVISAVGLSGKYSSILFIQLSFSSLIRRALLLRAITSNKHRESKRDKTNLNLTHSQMPFPSLVELNWKWIEFAQIQVVRWLLRIDTVLCNREEWRPITCKSGASFSGPNGGDLTHGFTTRIAGELGLHWDLYVPTKGLPACHLLFVHFYRYCFVARWIAIGNVLVSMFASIPYNRNSYK